MLTKHDIYRKKREDLEFYFRLFVLGFKILYYLLLIYSILG